MASEWFINELSRWFTGETKFSAYLFIFKNSFITKIISLIKFQ